MAEEQKSKIKKVSVKTQDQNKKTPSQVIKYNDNVEVICACGAKFTIASTEKGPIRVSLCSNCHPFYTGEQKIVDTDDLVSKYKEKAKKAKTEAKSRKTKREQKRAARSKLQTPDKESKKSLTLKDVMKALQKGK